MIACVLADRRRVSAVASALMRGRPIGETMAIAASRAYWRQVTPLGVASAGAQAAGVKGERWEILCDVPPSAKTDCSRTREKDVEPVRLVVPQLQPNRLYRFAVRAENAHGRSPFSKSAEARSAAAALCHRWSTAARALTALCDLWPRAHSPSCVHSTGAVRILCMVCGAAQRRICYAVGGCNVHGL